MLRHSLHDAPVELLAAASGMKRPVVLDVGALRALAIELQRTAGME
jgi:hypothetical protein